jgi:hypothetical protein
LEIIKLHILTGPLLQLLLKEYPHGHLRHRLIRRLYQLYHLLQLFLLLLLLLLHLYLHYHRLRSCC